MKEYRKKSNRLAELAYKIKRADELFNIDELADIDGIVEEYQTTFEWLILDLVDLAKIQKNKIIKANQIKKIRRIGRMVDLMSEKIDEMILLKKFGR